MNDSMTIAQSTACRLCGSDDNELLFELRDKPAGESDFGIGPQDYYRRVFQCQRCGVFYNTHDLLPEELYSCAYNQAVYRRKLADKFHQIMNLPPAQSDNKQRVRRVVAFCQAHGLAPGQMSVLDVGSGLCVFLAEMLKFGFRCSAIDPDPVAARHAVTVAGVDHVHAGTLEDFLPGELFDLITLNKVLEHLRDPIGQLDCARRNMNPNGMIYLELPDGAAALNEGSVVEREEFFVEHLTIYNRRSLQFLVKSAGLRPLDIESIRDPSGKCTLYAFCRQST